MAKYRVYVTDYEYETLENERNVLSQIDADFIPLQCKTDEDVISMAADADALLVQYAPITKKVFEELKNLKIVVRYGVGVDCVDLKAATKHGVYVCNVPDYGVEEVSTHAMALILDSVRNITKMANIVKRGTWDYKLSKPIYRTTRLTLGIAGFGRIPREVAKKAKPFGFNTIVYDPYVSSEVLEEFGVRRVDFDELLKESDIISVHTPLTKDTHHLFNKEAFSKMKKGSYIVNTSRGPVIDGEALADAIEEGILAGAALDVTEKEPIESDNRLLNYDNVVITPHMAWYSEEAQVDLQRKAAEEVVRVLLGDKPLNYVNIKV
ncbi:MAG: C-terminal binding protein [Thermoanaerobacteraceae bacterium]|nr:C-terminal binding protein [Thermoanaerobacteraceae bacterium]